MGQSGKVLSGDMSGWEQIAIEAAAFSIPGAAFGGVGMAAEGMDRNARMEAVQAARDAGLSGSEAKMGAAIYDSLGPEAFTAAVEQRLREKAQEEGHGEATTEQEPEAARPVPTVPDGSEVSQGTGGSGQTSPATGSVPGVPGGGSPTGDVAGVKPDATSVDRETMNNMTPAEVEGVWRQAFPEAKGFPPGKNQMIEQIIGKWEGGDAEPQGDGRGEGPQKGVVQESSPEVGDNVEFPPQGTAVSEESEPEAVTKARSDLDRKGVADLVDETYKIVPHGDGFNVEIIERFQGAGKAIRKSVSGGETIEEARGKANEIMGIRSGAVQADAEEITQMIHHAGELSQKAEEEDDDEYTEYYEYLDEIRSKSPLRNLDVDELLEESYTPSVNDVQKRIDYALSKRHEWATRRENQGKQQEEEPEKHEYSSTQVNLPKEQADKVLQAGQQIPDSDLVDKDGREMEPHVTVKYGLHTEDAEEIRPLVENEPPVRVKLGKTTVFETDDADVVVAEVESEDLRRINTKVAALGQLRQIPRVQAPTLPWHTSRRARGRSTPA